MPLGNELVKEVQRYDKYARYTNGRRETWSETCDRVISFFQQELEKLNKPIDKIPWETLRLGMLRQEVLPSMRSVQMAGPAAERDHVHIYNCAFTPLDSSESLVELLYILMCGTGVGYSVESHIVDKWPKVKKPCGRPPVGLTVEDSTKGWCEAFNVALYCALEGQEVVFDYSNIRPKGSPLKTKGGRASGPEPLARLLNETQRIISSKVGEKLEPFDIHRIACIAGSIVDVGGVRRAALIALFSPEDKRMRECKTGDWYSKYPELAKANNSMVASKDDIPNVMHTLKSDGFGEPGLFNRNSSHRRKGDWEYGTNPCLHPDSLVETIHGQMRIADITKPTMVYTMLPNGKLGLKPCSASFISKQNAKTLNITIASGKVIKCTPDHKIFIVNRGWIKAEDIKIGDKVVHLVRNRRGAAYSGVKLSTQNKKDFVMEHRLIWESVYGTMPPDYDIHHIDGNTYNNNINNLECLHHNAHARLTALEQPNNHQVKGAKGRFESSQDSRKGFKTIVSMPMHLKSNLHQYPTVIRIEQGDIVDVYDIQVEDTHNFIADFVVVHNCGEILLRPHQFCNLSIAVARPDDTLETLAWKVEMATLWGTIQSCMTNFPHIRAEWKQNCEEERLLGVDITGTQDCPLLNSTAPNVEEILIELRQVAYKTNKWWASQLGIPQSAAITCNKPSGNSSQLVDCSSGIHARWSPYYIRRLRIESNSPLGNHLVAKGIPYQKEGGSWVFEFPVASPPGAVVRSRMSGVDQIEYWLKWQTSWCDHNASSTIYVAKDEWPKVEQMVTKWWNMIGGLSFLPKDDHKYPLAPYEEIDQEEYEKRLLALPSGLELDTIVERPEDTTGIAEAACAGGFCEF